jgi:hypothetical protein
MKAADEFVVYDNIEYTKKGWINRNRMLQNGKDTFFTLPLKKDSDFLFIKDRFLCENWETEKQKILNKIKENYRKAPFFDSTFRLFENCINFKDTNLFNFIFNSLTVIKEHLEINTRFTISSDLEINHQLKSEKKVIEICKNRKAEIYINAIGGRELYSKNEFQQNNIDLKFIETGKIEYKQFDNQFISNLSILDLMMFNSKTTIKEFLQTEYTLI